MAAVNHLKDTFKISDNISHGLHGIYILFVRNHWQMVGELQN